MAPSQLTTTLGHLANDENEHHDGQEASPPTFHLALAEFDRDEEVAVAASSSSCSCSGEEESYHNLSV